VEDPNRKVPDLYFKVVDPKLQVTDLKAEVGDEIRRDPPQPLHGPHCSYQVNSLSINVVIGGLLWTHSRKLPHMLTHFSDCTLIILP